ncbi:hypothetical protein [Fluviicola taffensis]|uniref:Uncharacterized protein n=1 Tax=Fluviicola taffensis (strain DSM 16823 / NCIMB 13979 / RW262) TaxID=755732 RepID=F2ICI3_FLUTR|nr:hypothetical protein [Fluviicola taffensis]AEA45453.1 hypothetical protein Fluta_3482 [Fluviicola taffensis DSM 16823]
MKNNSAFFTLVCFGIILISMFLPFYEGFRPQMNFSKDSFFIVEIYQSTEFRARMIVFNGFGSLFALTNLGLAVLLVFARFYFPKSFATAISTAFIFGVSLVALIYGTSEGHGYPLPDSMLLGFYLLLIAQVVLITQSFTKAISAPPKEKRANLDSDILDF